MTKLNDLDISSDLMDQVSAIVLGGGRGTRLYPLTDVRAKPAVPLCGRYRLVDIPLSNCIHSGVMTIYVLTQFNSHSLNRHINNTYQFDSFTNGAVEVLTAEQTAGSGGNDWFQGTADAVRKQWSHIIETNPKYYLILSGDQLYRMDYRTMLRTHLQRNADITVAALPVNQAAARGFGIMKVQGSGRIKEFVEKPTQADVLAGLVTPKKVFDDFGLKSRGKPYLGSMGVYIFKARVLEELLMKNKTWIDFGKEIIPKALPAHKVYAHMFTGYWEDIGTVRSYFDASMAMTSPRPPFELYDPKHLFYTHARALPGVKIDSANVQNCIICGGSRIGRASVTNSILGIRSVIQGGVEADRMILLGAEYYEDSGNRRRKKVPIGLGADAKISDAIIDHNARIGKGVVIRGSKKLKDMDTPNYAIREGIVIVKKNGVIPDGTQIG